LVGIQGKSDQVGVSVRDNWNLTWPENDGLGEETQTEGSLRCGEMPGSQNLNLST
jgi:hypothetical protein